MKRPWIWIAISLVLGELAGYVMHIWGLLWIAGMGIFLLLCKKKRKRIFIFMAVFSLGICLMLFQPQGKISDEMGKVRFCITKIEATESGRRLIGDGILVYLKEDQDFPELRIGYQIEAEGKEGEIRPARNPGEFDAELYYRAAKIRRILFAKEIHILRRRSDPFRQFLLELRLSGLEKLARIYPEKEQGILSAALFGERSLLEDEIYALYKDAGIAHLLAISGLHISILGLSVYTLLRKKCRLGFLPAGMISAVFLCGYSILTGEGVSVVRAVTMLCLVFIAEIAGRSYDLLSAACISACMALCFSPYMVFQSGFLLSFGAVISIGGPGNLIIHVFNLKQKKLHIRILQALVLSLVVQICTLPILSYFFFSFSPYAVIVNILVIPLMAAVIWSALCAIGFSCISLPAARLAAGSSVYILRGYAAVAKFSLSLPFSKIRTGRPTMWQIGIYYALLLGICMLLYHIQQKKELYAKKIKSCIPDGISAMRYIKWIFCPLIYLICILLLLPLPKNLTEISCLDIGQGDSILLESQGEVLLIDSGSTTNKKAGEYILEQALLAKAVGKISRAVITHADADHTNAFIWLLEHAGEIEIGEVCLPYLAIEDKKYDILREAIKRRNIPIHYMQAGESFVFGRGEMLCIWPKKDASVSDTNEQSLTLLYLEGEFRALFTGDAGKESENRFVPEAGDLLHGLTLLKIGHHGSYSATGDLLMKTAEPKYAIISYGENNSYGHPHKETMDRLNWYGTKVYETGGLGAVIVRTDGKYIGIENFGR